MEVVTRKAAKAAGLTRFFTGQPCKHGHVAERGVSNGACKVCERRRAAAWQRANPRKARVYNAAWKARNPGKVQAGRDVWEAKNPGKVNAKNAKHKAAQLQATPAWADHEAIRDAYLEAAYQGRAVDHIVPLQGRNVCGLHWEGNLQLLTKSQNSAKGNRLLDNAHSI